MSENVGFTTVYPFGTNLRRLNAISAYIETSFPLPPPRARFDSFPSPAWKPWRHGSDCSQPFLFSPRSQRRGKGSRWGAGGLLPHAYGCLRLHLFCCRMQMRKSGPLLFFCFKGQPCQRLRHTLVLIDCRRKIRLGMQVSQLRLLLIT